MSKEGIKSWWEHKVHADIPEIIACTWAVIIEILIITALIKYIFC